MNNLYSTLKGSIDKFVSNPNIDGGLFITGEWGIGKTFFIDKILRDHCKNKLNRELCYISLTGLESKKDLKNRILTKSFFAKGDKWSLKGAKFITNFKGLAPFLDVLSASDLAEVDSGLYVFDDLERIGDRVEISEVLQILNYELNHAKIIFIANESRVKSSDYTIIKEKFIYKTLRFPIYYESTVNAIIEKFECSNRVESIFKSNREFISEVYLNFSFYNFRTLKFSLSIIEEILEEFDDSIIGLIILDIIYFVLVISELKRFKLL